MIGYHPKRYSGLNRHYFESILQLQDLRGVVLESYGSGICQLRPGWLQP